jgi:hypothetical protein
VKYKRKKHFSFYFRVQSIFGEAKVTKKKMRPPNFGSPTFLFHTNTPRVIKNTPEVFLNNAGLLQNKAGLFFNNHHLLTNLLPPCCHQKFA